MPRPLTIPPGASYRASNAMIRVRQKFLRLEAPINISFEDNKWKASDPMYDWYTRRMGENRVYIETIQLRKEVQSPFFHEFIVFSLRGGGFYRIDRRQKPDEELPMDAIYTYGVQACDTIEEVPDLNSVLYARSQCLMDINFKADVNVHVGLILRICRAIQKHEHANVYTLQRYNCYFFAQTLIMCAACGASDWAGLGEPKGEAGKRASPWRTPNTSLVDFAKSPCLDNKGCLAAFKWDCSENFNHDWGHLSRLSNTLVHASPLLRHADHCNYCLESQSIHRQRSLSSEINRLKHALVEHWNGTYRDVLAEIYYTNHKNFVASGVWRIIEGNPSEANSKQVIQDKLDTIKARWEEYSRQRRTALVTTVHDLLDPAEVCDAWYPDPDEWKSTWTCKDGGPVKAAMDNWERETEKFFNEEFPKLAEHLENQAVECGTQAHKKAMVARMDSFKQSMTIKLRVLDESEFLEAGAEAPSQPTEDEDRQSGVTKKTGRTFLSRMTHFTQLTQRAREFKTQMSRIFKKNHKLEESDVIQMQQRIGMFIVKHGGRVEQYKFVLKCSAEEVERDMRSGMDEVWNYVIS